MTRHGAAPDASGPLQRSAQDSCTYLPVAAKCFPHDVAASSACAVSGNARFCIFGLIGCIASRSPPWCEGIGYVYYVNPIDSARFQRTCHFPGSSVRVLSTLSSLRFGVESLRQEEEGTALAFLHVNIKNSSVIETAVMHQPPQAEIEVIAARPAQFDSLFIDISSTMYVAARSQHKFV